MPLGRVGDIFDWFSNQQTLDGRAEYVAQVGPHLMSLIKPGDRVLDLGCGGGAVALFLADQGALVTGVDLAPGLLALAREEAGKRGAKINFVQADVLTHELGEGLYDWVLCLGNVILDFPHQEFPGFRDKVARALKPAGRLALGYRDGMLRLLSMSEPQEVVEEGTAGQIVRRFQGYDPVQGAYMSQYRHTSTGETYDYTGYLYTGPLIRLVMEPRLRFERSIRLGEMSFIDVYANLPGS